MQYYFNVNRVEDSFFFSPEDIHHLTHVLRANSGDKIICVFQDVHYLCSLVFEHSIPKAIIEKTLETNNELPFEVTLIYGLPKSDKFELVLQKATELGVSRIVPFQADRSVVKLDKGDNSSKYLRWERIAKEAAEQSRRNRIPVISPVTLRKDLQLYVGEWNLFADENEWTQGTQKLWDYSTRQFPKTISVIIGPEGGFSSDELSFFSNNGWDGISLGHRILRSETAAISILAWLSFLGDSKQSRGAK